MPTYKLFKNGSLVNTILADEQFLSENPGMYDTYELVPEEPIIMPEPEISSPPVVINEPIKIVSPVEFKLLFLSLERIAIKNSTDPVIQDFYDIVNDPRLTYVDLTIPATTQALLYLVSQGIISDRRRIQILNAESPTPD